MSSNDAYARAGVNIDAGNRATELMTAAVKSTYTPQVLAGIGAFGGLYDAAHLKSMDAPVLVASTDGVGTKTKVVARMNRWDTIGRDLVNHCINDILVQGARPLFFLDYVASSRLNPEQIASVVGGVAAACRDAGCALLGGETAEMPGVYLDGELDLAGTIIGVVDRAHLIDGSRIQPGDAILGLPSSGLHTNGYSLARRVLDPFDWGTPHPDLDQPIGEALLAVHRSYLEPVTRLQSEGIDIRGMAHITGGGILDNLPRILPDGARAAIRHDTWPTPPLFRLLQQLGSITGPEMFRAFNMGLGMLVVVPCDQAPQAQAALPSDCFIVGEIIAGSKDVQII
jgi:phosphoribosylformylglycinamidine cyclo-ligase